MTFETSKFKIQKRPHGEKLFDYDNGVIKNKDSYGLNYDITDEIKIVNITKEMLNRMKDLAAAISGLPVSTQIVGGRGTFITYSLNKDGERIGATINIDLSAVTDDIVYVVNNIRKSGKNVNWFDVEAIVKRDFYHELAHLMLTESDGTGDIYKNYSRFFEPKLKRPVYEKIIGFLFNACEDARIETQIIDVFPGLEKYFEFSYSYMIDHKIKPFDEKAASGDLKAHIFLTLLAPYLLGLGYYPEDLIISKGNEKLKELCESIYDSCMLFSEQIKEEDAVEILGKEIWPPVRDYLEHFYEDELANAAAEWDENGEPSDEIDLGGQTIKYNEMGAGSPIDELLPGDGGQVKFKNGTIEFEDGSKAVFDKDGKVKYYDKDGNEIDGPPDNAQARGLSEKMTKKKPELQENYSEDIDQHEHRSAGNILTEEAMMEALNDLEEYIKETGVDRQKTDSNDSAASEEAAKKNLIVPDLVQYKNFSTERSFVHIQSCGNNISSEIANILAEEETYFAHNILPRLRRVLQDNEKMGYDGAFNSGKHLNQKRILKYKTQRDMHIFQRTVAQHKKDYVFYFMVDGSGSMGGFNAGREVDMTGIYTPASFMTAVVSYCFAQALQSLSIPLRIDVWDSGYYHESGIRDIVDRNASMDIYPTDVVSYRRIKDFNEPITHLFKGQRKKLAGFAGSGGTPEYDAITYGIEVLSNRSEQVKILVSLTDGCPGSSVGTHQQIEVIKDQYKVADRHGINIFAIGFGHQEIKHHRQTAIIQRSVKDLEHTIINIMKTFIA